MRKIAAMAVLVLALNLYGCKSDVGKSQDNNQANTNTENKIQNKTEDKADNKAEDKTKVNEEVNNNTNKVKNESKKQEYITKLNNIEMELKVLEKKESSGTTADMRAAAGEKYKRWDSALNEIYNVLKTQLSSNDMKKLQSEELQWISDRDAKAKKASLEMKGGTMEPVIYTASLAETTKNRCYELVEKYMQ